ncbi:MAG: hypothetical protein JWM27_2254 [Gemmatimonadetes bacterium]|nr:hypothetical protein [Gemmatimonadota bacterium]
MKPLRLLLAAIALSAAGACSRTPTSPSTAPASAHQDVDNGGYMGSGLKTDTTKAPPPAPGS